MAVNFQKEMKREVKINNEAVESGKKCFSISQVENIK